MTERPGGEDALDRGALELASALRTGDVDVRAHAESILDLAAETGSRVGAFAHLLPERTRDQAARAHDELTRARREGRSEELARTRPLLGVPLPIKELARIDGEPFEAGSALLQGMRADRTDGVARRILDGGTLTVGTTSSPEFGMPCYTEPAHRLPARTPWDLTRTAGGSSGGAAAAVASGIAPIAHGSDGGGSVRIPASCCGVLGLKTSRGLVSPGPHSAEGAGLVSDGVLARTVADLAAGLDLIAGTLPGDAAPLRAEGSYLARLCSTLPSTQAQALPRAQDSKGTSDPGRALPAQRIGLLLEPLAADTEVHPASLRAVQRAREALEALGHEVVQIPAPYAPAEWRTFMPLWTVGAATIPVPPEAEGALTLYTQWLRERGREYTGVELLEALTGMQSLARRVGEAFEGLDAVLTPTLAAPPLPPSRFLDLPPAEDFEAQCAFTPWTSTWNMTGRAAISVPLHREVIEGVELPIGVQLGAVRAGDEALLLALAAQLETVDPWPLIAPLSA